MLLQTQGNVSSCHVLSLRGKVASISNTSKYFLALYIERTETDYFKHKEVFIIFLIV